MGVSWKFVFLSHLWVISFSSASDFPSISDQIMLNDNQPDEYFRNTLGKSPLHNPSSNDDIVILRWPEAKRYTPNFDMTPEATERISSRLDLESSQPLPSSSDTHAVPDLLPAPDEVYTTQHPKVAPYPPHPDYVGNSANPDNDEEDDEDDPEAKWKKMRTKLSLRPVDHNFFKTGGKHTPTLPYAPTQPFTDLQYAINQVRRAVYKVSPSRRLANEAFKQFNVAVKARIKNMRGPYAYSYPPGYYDFRYEADDNPAPSEAEPVYVPPPIDMRVDNETAIDHSNSTLTLNTTEEIERRSGVPSPVLDEEEERLKNLEQRSFGFKVTVYRTPGNKENLTEEIFDGDRHFVFRTPPEAAGSASKPVKIPGDLAAIASYPKNYFTGHVPKGTGQGYYNPAPQVERIHHETVTGETEGKRSKLHQDTHSKTIDLAAYEHKKKQRMKEETSHDKRASNERALKERTVIEFFEREKIPQQHYHHDTEDDKHHGHLPHSHHNPHHQPTEKTPYYIEGSGKSSDKKLYYEPSPEESRQRASISSPGKTQSSSRIRGSSYQSINDNANNKTSNTTRDLQKKGTHVVDYVYHPKKGNYGPSSSSLRHHFPSLDENNDSNGWRETGYKIVTEVEYLDKDAHQEKGFEARDKGKAEHVKDMIEKSNYKGEVKGSSYDTGISSYNGNNNEDYNINYPRTDFADSNRHELVTKDPAIFTNTRKQSRIPPHALDQHVSRDELVKKLNQQKFLNTSDQMSMSDSLLSVQHASPVISNIVAPPDSLSLTAGLKRVDRLPPTNFVEIIANGSYPYTVYNPSTTSTTTTSTTENTRMSLTSTTTTSTTTEIPVTDYYWTTDGTESIERTTIPTTTSTASYKLRKPPSHVNALTIIESPVIISNGSESQIVEQKVASEPKFSKLVSIEEPLELVQARLALAKKKKLKEQEAKEKFMALLALQKQLSSKNHNYFHDKYHHQPVPQSGSGQKFIQYFYNKHPFASVKKPNSKYQTSSSNNALQMIKLFGVASPSLTRIPLPSHSNPYNTDKQTSSVMHALQSSLGLGYGFPSTIPSSSSLPLTSSSSNVVPSHSVNNLLKTSTQARKSVLNRLAQYRPLQKMLPSMKNFQFLPPPPSSPSSPSSPSLSASLFPLQQPHQYKVKEQ